MDENPYESPAIPADPRDAAGDSSLSYEELRSIARLQRALIGCLLVQASLVIALFVLPALEMSAEIPLFTMFGVFILTTFVQALCVELLGSRLNHRYVGALLAVVALVPCLGILVVVVLILMATQTLRDNGFPVT